MSLVSAQKSDLTDLSDIHRLDKRHKGERKTRASKQLLTRKSHTI